VFSCIDVAGIGAPSVVIFARSSAGVCCTPHRLAARGNVQPHTVTAIVPGPQTLEFERRAATSCGKWRPPRTTALAPWHTNRVVWLMPFNGAHAVGHSWNDARDEFAGYYINLQAPLRRTPPGQRLGLGNLAATTTVFGIDTQAARGTP
jgi:hypothetical protein